jgi:hypothetical protein
MGLVYVLTLLLGVTPLLGLFIVNWFGDRSLLLGEYFELFP